MSLKNAWPLIKQTISDWSEDEAPTQAAALAYYTIFSIAPLLIIAVGVAGIVFGDSAVRGEVHQQIQGLVGSNGARFIEDMMVSAGRSGSGVIATILGVGVLIFGASGVFIQLQQTMNVIWKVKTPPTTGILNLLRVRFLSFAMVLGIGFLLLVSLIISAGLAAIGAYFEHVLPASEWLWHVVNIAASLGVISLLFAMIYKILPDTHVQWRDVWLGAVVTALLFSLGKFAIGLYLGKTSVASGYGAAGSVAIVLIWVYYSAQILFLGAEFTQVYAKFRAQRGKPTTELPPKKTPERIPPATTWLPT